MSFTKHAQAPVVQSAAKVQYLFESLRNVTQNELSPFFHDQIILTYIHEQS